MSTLHSENWDSPTPPSLPSGWNVSGGTPVTAVGGGGTPTPISPPNMVYAHSTGGAFHTLTWGTADTNSGNVTVTGTVNFYTSDVDTCSVFARGSAATLIYTSSTFYDAQFSAAGLTISNWQGPTQHVVAHSTITGGVVTINTWYRITLAIDDTSGPVILTGYVQRLSDGYWLDTSSNWTSTPTSAIFAVDSTGSPISGSGYSGWAASCHGDDVYGDDWGLLTGGTHLYYLGAPTAQYLTVGNTATVHAGFGIGVASPATFYANGVTIGMSKGHGLPAATGAYTVTGHSSSPMAVFAYTASKVNYAVTGQPAALNWYVNRFRQSSVSLSGSANLQLAATMKGIVGIPIIGVSLDTAVMQANFNNSFLTGSGAGQVDIQYTESMPLPANTPTTIGFWGDPNRYDSLGQPLNLARIKFLAITNNNSVSGSLGGKIKMGCGAATHPILSFWNNSASSVVIPDGGRFAVWCMDATGYAINSLSAYQLYLDPGSVSSSYTMYVFGCRE